VRLDAGESVRRVLVEIRYDPQKLRFEGANATSPMFNATEPTKGVIDFDVTLDGASGPLVLGELGFRLRSPLAGDSDLEASVIDLTHADGSAAPAITQGAHVHAALIGAPGLP